MVGEEGRAHKMSDVREELVGVEESSVCAGHQMSTDCLLERGGNILTPWQRTISPPTLWVLLEW